MKIDLPSPDAQQIKRSEQCMQLIVDAIEAQQGSISFAEYMNICLYSEKVGYYQSGEEIFGAEGDFTTGPETSSYFATAFACYVQRLQENMPEFSIVEVGAGSGKFAHDLIASLKQQGCQPSRYIIIEKSETLIARQKNKLSDHCDCCDIVWLQQTDEPIENAIVIANEVLDALPVNLLAVRNNQVKERRVTLDEHGALKFIQQSAAKYLDEAARERIPASLLQQDQQDYLTDINVQLNSFVEQIASFVKQGIFFFVDYGYPRSEYYHQQRYMGTVVCHFKHALNDSLLMWPGLQDISSSVDFTSLAEEATQFGLQLNCYSTQAHFLLASQVLQQVEVETDAASINAQAELKRLLMPGEMGERFQVMVLSKNIDLSGYQFTLRDLCHRL